MSIYIPEKIKVGYVERGETFDGKLAYINYFNKSKKWALEKSWEKWRDKSIEATFWDNAPMSGFVVHKGQVRYSDFAGKSTMIRIYHPNGFEFEITASNLCAVLTHSNTSSGFINQECVLGWEGGQVILLPTNSDIYKSSMEITKSFKDKLKDDLKIGSYYKFVGDSNSQYIYLGAYKTYKKDRYENVTDVIAKEHFFKSIDRDCIITTSKAKVWKEIGTESDGNVYINYVKDLKDFEYRLLNNEGNVLFNFRDLKDSEIDDTVNSLIKKIISNNLKINDGSYGMPKLKDETEERILKYRMNEKDHESLSKIFIKDKNLCLFWNKEKINEHYYKCLGNPADTCLLLERYDELSYERLDYIFNSFLESRCYFFNKNMSHWKESKEQYNVSFIKLIIQNIKDFTKKNVEVSNSRFFNNGKFIDSHPVFREKFYNFFVDLMESEEIKNCLKSSLKKFNYRNETMWKYYNLT